MTSSRLDRGRHRAGAPRRSPADQHTDGPQALERVGPAHRARPTRTRGRRVAGMVTGFMTAAVLTATVAWAVITAVATGTGDVGTATLKLTQTGNGDGLTAEIRGMLPGDVRNRYVTVTNGGTADGQSLTLAVTSQTANKLVTNVSAGLQISVTGCSVPWTVSNNTGTCTGDSALLLATSPVANMGTAKGLGAGGTFAAGTSKHLQVSLTLPNQDETTTDGALPGDSIQGLTNRLTYTFSMVQRGATTTNS